MRCPVCNADNSQGPLCRRCRADLTLLFGLEAQQARLLLQARAALRTGDALRAEQMAASAAEEHDTSEVRQLLALCRLWRRDFAGAWSAYPRRVK
jgi:hypothetical protein